MVVSVGKHSNRRDSDQKNAAFFGELYGFISCTFVVPESVVGVFIRKVIFRITNL